MSAVLPTQQKLELQKSAWRSQWRTYGQAYAMLLPAVTIIGLLFGGGLVLAFLQSIGAIGILGAGNLSLSAYGVALRNPDFLRSLGLSLYIAIVATGASTILSIALAMALRKAGRWASVACQITLPIPHLVGIAGILLLLSPSGLISRLLYAIGWIQSDQDFPLLVNDAANVGVLLHFLWKEIPFMTLILLAVLRGINPAYEMQARALGASPWQCFWNVTLPMMKSGILSASLIVFGYIFASFEVPFLLGSTRPRTLPVLVYRAFTDSDLTRRPEAIALGMILSILSILIIVTYSWVISRDRSSMSRV